MVESLGGYVTDTIPRTKTGEASNFIGEFHSKIGDKAINMGILHYNWKRKIGVDKINQAIKSVNNTELDGALIVGSAFSHSALELAERINQVERKKVLLFEVGAVNFSDDDTLLG